MNARESLVLIMGVAGSGKTTVGRLLARELGWPYHEADDFHPPENVAKMSRGEPLTDADRQPWLERIRAQLQDCAGRKTPGVFSCSALKQSYRDTLLRGLTGVLLVHLDSDPHTIRARVEGRKDHFMKAAMLESQFAALERPRDALILNARERPEDLVRRIIAALES